MKLISRSPLETQKIAASLLKKYLNKIKKEGMTIFLEGELGTGKTVFVQGLANALKIKKEVKSPTFIIFKKYSNQKGLQLVHVDCYRLKDSKELENLGIDDFFNKPYYLVVIEWPLILKVLKKKIKNPVEIKIKHLSLLEREIRIKEKPQ